MQPLTNIFRKARLEKGLTIEGAAKEIGISAPTLSKIENNDRSCTVKVLIKLCDFYNIPYEDGVNFIKE